MDILTILIGTIIFMSTVIICMYIYFLRCYKYWQNKGVEIANPPVFPMGNLGDFFAGRSTPAQIFNKLYKSCTGPFAGVYILNSPGLLIKDPEYIKYVLVKDFNHFNDRGVDSDTKREPLTEHLFVLKGQKWRHLRTKLSPTFTSGKLKLMFQTLKDCGTELQKALQSSADKNLDIEIKEYVARYTTDIISSVAFGIQSNSVHNPDSEFRNFGKKIFEASFIKSIKNGLMFVAPSLVKFFRLKFLDTESTNFFTNALKETIKYRENNKISRQDFLQMLIELKNKGQLDADVTKIINKDLEETSNDCLSLNQVLAQSFVFFIAGFETSSSTMNFCLYELAINTDIQTKLQQEIDSNLEKYNGEITYDSISEMEYLDNIISETLRKYPVLEILNRKCTKRYQIPHTNVLIEEGTTVIIPVSALHHDPKYFPNPEKFNPDRFLPENKNWDPYCYLPFGEGPRNCIGARMGRLQTKVGLISILSKFDVNVCDKTDIPLTFSKLHIILTTEKELLLKISNRKF